MLALRARAPVAGARPAVDDHLDVGVVAVVLDHPGQELLLELRRDHAVDHDLK